MKLLYLNGPSGSGKDWIAQSLVNQGWLHLKFAALLRGIVYIKYGLDPAKIGDKDYELNYAIPWLSWSPQELLLRVGADARDFHPDIFVWGALYLGIKHGVSPNCPGIVISDCRQPNEAAILRALGFQGGKLTGRSTRPEQPLDRLLHDGEFTLTGEILVKLYRLRDRPNPLSAQEGQYGMIMRNWIEAKVACSVNPEAFQLAQDYITQINTPTL